MIKNRQTTILFIPTSSGKPADSAEEKNLHSRHDPYESLVSTVVARAIYTREGLQSLGRQLAAIAHHAYLARRPDAVEQVIQVMLSLPLSEEQRNIARYYHAILCKHAGDFEGARQLLEQLLDRSTPNYGGRVLLTLAATYFDRGEADASLPFYLAAGCGSERDHLTLAECQKMTAVVRGLHGDHKQAVAELERLFPMVRALSRHYPALYYDYLNSLAVEFGEVGRIAEAQSALSIALTSPFASAYPEWHETRDELEAKRTSATPSFIAVERVPQPDRSAKIHKHRNHRRITRRNVPPANIRVCRLVCAVTRATPAMRRSPIIAIGSPTRFILDRLGESSQPRAPPASR